MLSWILPTLEVTHQAIKTAQDLFLAFPEKSSDKIYTMFPSLIIHQLFLKEIISIGTSVCSKDQTTLFMNPYSINIDFLTRGCGVCDSNPEGFCTAFFNKKSCSDCFQEFYKNF